MTHARTRSRTLTHDCARLLTHPYAVEVIGLRLYTGPMFALYNGKMRQFPADTVKYLRLLGPLAFVTTLHAINSGILKMARFSVIPGGPHPRPIVLSKRPYLCLAEKPPLNVSNYASAPRGTGAGQT